MPNTGKPSQDCHLCRRRRVKCDLTRPSCNRCIKYGAECPGYRTQQELVFRNATPATTKKKKKRTSPPSDESETAASPADDTSGSATPSTVGDLVRAIPNRSDEFPPLWTEHTSAVHVPLARSLNQHWTQHSVPILLNVYSALDFLHNTYRVYDRNGPLLWAAHLFSRTYVTNLRNPTAIRNDSSDETDKMLGMYMGKTLKAVSQALSKPDGAFRDDVLATVWILANYEILVGSLGVEPMSPWHLHTKGMYTMLQMRGVESIKTDKGRTAFWPVYNMIQIQSLMANIEAPAESDEWLRTIEEHMFPGEALTLYIAVFITKVCKFQAQAIKYIRSRDFAGMSAYYRQGWQLMTSAENELKEWIDSQPPFEHELDPYMRNMQYSAIVKGYHIMQMMCNMLTHYPPCPIPVEELLTHRRFCLQTLRIASQGILSNIPYAIGPLARGKDKSPRVLFDALKLIWPLLCVYMVSTTTQEQKKTAWTTLRFIGDEVGVKQATKAHENMVLLPPEALEPLVLDGADVQWVASPEVDVAFMGMI